MDNLEPVAQLEQKQTPVAKCVQSPCIEPGLVKATESPSAVDKEVLLKRLLDKREKVELETHPFNADSYTNLCGNEGGRFMPNSKKIAHLWVVNQEDGLVGKQFDIQRTTHSSMIHAPTLRPLVDIKEVKKFGLIRYLAKTPNGTQMAAKRQLQMTYQSDDKADKIEGRLYLFSPVVGDVEKVYWGGREEQSNCFKPILSESPSQQLYISDPDFKYVPPIEVPEASMPNFKKELSANIDPKSVKARHALSQRSVPQNTVMGKTAAKAYEDFLTEYGPKLNKDRKEQIEKSIKASKDKDKKVHQYQLEWLHAVAHSLASLETDPQSVSNLGAAPKWVNTKMMLLESVARWFSLNAPLLQVTLKSMFEMILNTDLIEKIVFDISVENKGSRLTLMQEIFPFMKMPIFDKASDQAQVVLVANALLHKLAPIKSDNLSTKAFSMNKPVTKSLLEMSALFGVKKDELEEDDEEKIIVKESDVSKESVGGIEAHEVKDNFAPTVDLVKSTQSQAAVDRVASPEPTILPVVIASDPFYQVKLVMDAYSEGKRRALQNDLLLDKPELLKLISPLFGNTDSAELYVEKFHEGYHSVDASQKTLAFSREAQGIPINKRRSVSPLMSPRSKKVCIQFV